MSWWPFGDDEEFQTAMIKHLAEQQDTQTKILEAIMAEFTALNSSLEKLAADVDTFLATNAALKTENETLKAENEALKAADATDQSNVDAAQGAVDAIDAKVTA